MPSEVELNIKPIYKNIDIKTEKPPLKSASASKLLPSDCIDSRKEFLKQPKISSTGVYPSRKSTEIESLNVMLIGSSLPDFPAEKVVPNESIFVHNTPFIKDTHELQATVEKTPRKPAILSSEGTTVKPVFTKRAKPPLMPRSRLKQKRKTRFLPSFQDTTIHTTTPVPEEEKNDKIVNLLPEPFHKSLEAQDKVKSVVSIEITEPASSPVRSVDEMIQALRSSRQSRSNQKSASDQKIDEIMKQVMSHTQEWMDENLSKSVPTEQVATYETVETENVEQTLDEKEPDENIQISIIDEAEIDISDTVSTLASQISAPAGIPDVTSILARKSSHAMYGRSSSETSSPAMMVVPEDDDSFDKKQAELDLNLSLNVNYDDIVSIQGENPPLIEKPALSLHIDKDAAFREVEIDPFYFDGGRIHRLCLLPSIKELNATSSEIALTKYLHTHSGKLSEVDTLLNESEKAKQTLKNTDARVAKTTSVIPDPEYLDSSKLDPLDLEGWRNIVEGAFEKNDYLLSGSCTNIGEVGAWRLLNSAVPPKMALSTAAVKALVFPSYHGSQVIEDEVEEKEISWTEADELSEIIIEEEEKREFNEKSIYRRHLSAENITTYFVDRDGGKREIVSDTFEIKKYPTLLPTNSERKLLENLDTNSETDSKYNEESIDMKKVGSLRKTRSVPRFEERFLEYGSLCWAKTDYSCAMAEIKYQLESVLKQQISELQSRENQESSVSVPRPDSPTSNLKFKENKSVEKRLNAFLIPPVAPPPTTPAHPFSLHQKKPSPRKTKDSFVILGKKKSTSRRSKRLAAKLRRSMESYIPLMLNRSSSFGSFFPVETHNQEKLPAVPNIKSKIFQLKGKIRRSTSIPDMSEFSWFVSRNLKYGEKINDMREWVRDIWNTWFDELYPPTDDESSVVDSEPVLEAVNDLKEEDKFRKFQSEVQKLFIPDKLPSSVAVLIDDIEEPEEVFNKKIRELSNQLDELVPEKDVERSCHLCMRGALFRKMGEIKLAYDDLNEAVILEPHLAAAYWQRHLIHLLKNQKHDALDDLNALLKLDPTNVHAFRSRADVFASLGDYTMAIVNYSQAVKLDPNNSEIYHQRAKLFEKTGDMLLAMEDYSAVYRLNNNKTDALLRRALYNFNKKSWLVAVSDFTQLIEKEPLNSQARTYRAQASWELGQDENALKDFSAAIHLDPLNTTAYYYRGALVRKISPEQALQDLSVSLLLDNSEKNVLALLHRGILYGELRRYSEALADFEQTLRIDGSLVCAQVNIGIIQMTVYQNYWGAIKRFSSALKQVPTYTRAHECRADAYGRVHNYEAAVHDITRAIHMRPTQRHLYLRRGKFLLQLRQLKLAAFCVQHIATLDKSFVGTSATQQAVVQSFLGNHEEACESLNLASRSKPVPSMYVLLAKTLMKGKRFKDAIHHLMHALELTAIYSNGDVGSKNSISEETRIHFLLGQCHTELDEHEQALSSYNHAIKENAHFSEAYYYRGLCKIKLEVGSGIQDLNRALALNPDLFEAYLSRAAYYSTKKRFSKAILNCNEALRLRPLSVRALLCRGALKFFISAYYHAINDLSKAIELDKQCTLAYYNRAVCLHTTKNYYDALKDYSIVLVLGENDSSVSGLSLKSRVYVNRALLYLQSEMQDAQNAAIDLQQASLLHPNDTGILYTMAICHHKMKELSAAYSAYTQCLLVEPLFLAAYVGRGDAFHDAGKFEDAKLEYERALRLDPLYEEARIHLGYNLLMRGLLQQAWTQFTVVLDRNSNCLSAREGRSITCLHAGDMAAASRDISIALKTDRPTARLLTISGVIHQNQKDFYTAMAHYNKSQEIDPLYAPAHFNAAALYIRDRRFSAAFECLQTVVRLNPIDSAALLNRGIVRVFLNDTKNAMRDFNFACRLDPHNSHILFNRGNLHFMLEDYENAIKDFNKAFDINPSDYVTLKRRADAKGCLGQKKGAVEDYKKSLLLLEHHQRLRKLQRK